MDLLKDFTEELAAFLAATGITPSGFGRRALGDPNFVAELNQGRSPNLRTIARARAFMARETARLAAIAARNAAKGGKS
jgi:predicted transcriptional regulator